MWLNSGINTIIDSTPRPIHRTRLSTVISYLLFGVIAIRGILEYQDDPSEQRIIAIMMTTYLVWMLVEPFITKRVQWFRWVYPAGHVIIMLTLYVSVALSDTWAINLFPICIYVIGAFETRTGYWWIAGFSLAMTVGLSIQHTILEVLIYGPIYIWAYIFISSYAVAVKQARAARRESQTLLEKLQEAHSQLEDHAANAEALAIMEERTHLARELHDSVTQTIFSMTLITRSTLILQDRDPAKVPSQLEKLNELAQAALSEMRSLIYQLRPTSIADEGLIQALRKHIAMIERRDSLEVTLDIQEPMPNLNLQQQQEIFRIIQEALNNVAKHAESSSAGITIQLDAQHLLIEIQDSGKGFDAESVDQNHNSFGLKTMRERANSLGGSLAINSSPGHGTRVCTRISIEEEI